MLQKRKYDQGNITPMRNNRAIRNSISGNALSIDSNNQSTASTVEVIKSDLEKYIASLNDIYEGKSKSIGSKETTRNSLDGKKLFKSIDLLVDLNKKQLESLKEITKTLKKPKEEPKSLESVKAKSVLDVLEQEDEKESKVENVIENVIEKGLVDRILGGGSSEKKSRPPKRVSKKSTIWERTKKNIPGIGAGLAVAGGIINTGTNLHGLEKDLDSRIEEINVMVEQGDISKEEGAAMIESLTSETRTEQKKEGIVGVGGIAGGVAGAKLLGGLGSFAGPIGAAVGTVVGGIGGTILGSMGGEALFNKTENKNSKGFLEDVYESAKKSITGVVESDKFKEIVSEMPKSISDFVLSVPEKASRAIDSVSDYLSPDVSPSKKLSPDHKMISTLKRETENIKKEETSTGSQVNVSSIGSINLSGQGGGFTPTPRRDSLSSLDRYLDKVSRFI